MLPYNHPMSGFTKISWEHAKQYCKVINPSQSQGSNRLNNSYTLLSSNSWSMRKKCPWFVSKYSGMRNCVILSVVNVDIKHRTSSPVVNFILFITSAGRSVTTNILCSSQVKYLLISVWEDWTVALFSLIID